MDDFPIVPPLVVKDSPKPRRLATLVEARAYVDEALRIGRPAPWREVWHRLKSVTTEDEAIEAIGDMRELLASEGEALRLHLRSYCPEMPVPPGLLLGADRRRDDVGRHDTTFPGRRTTSRKNEQAGRTR
jgi:hypothetical protein